MATESEHGKIIAAAAKAALLPLGVKRRGRSRTYLSDEGLWAIVIEFQPSGFSKGSYLNVGAHWLWTTHDYVSFNFGYRVHGFEPFDDAMRFEDAAKKLAEIAAGKVATYRSLFPSVAAIAARLAEKEALTAVGCWGAYHAAIANGLCGDAATARSLFAKLMDAKGGELVQWVRERREDAAALDALVSDRAAFRALIAARIATTRQRLKLGERAIVWDESNAPDQNAGTRTNR